MKEKILQLRNEGKSYSEIKKILNCSKSTISYYCGINQKEKTRDRTKKNRDENPLIQKVDNFKQGSRQKRNFVESVRKFQKRDNKSNGKVDTQIKVNFNWKDIVEKFGVDTFCYLSGEPLNLNNKNFSLDHIIPSSKGGPNTLDNLGITHRVVNEMKNDLLVPELLEWCIKILKFNGYDVKKMTQ